MSFFLAPEAEAELAEAASFYAPAGQYPYSLLYRAEPGAIRILAIAHHSRRPGNWERR